MTDLAAVRRRYAARMMSHARVEDSRLETAFARVPREDFVGPAPWTLIGERDAVGDPADPVSLYADVLVALDPLRGLNNGSPSLHALMLHRLGAQPGETVLHAGAGSGYYSAVLAEIVGPSGHVIAVEADPKLAVAARRNLAPWPNVNVVQGDSAEHPRGLVPRIYVNFAVAMPAPRWLDGLALGGALVMPLGVAKPGSLRGKRQPVSDGGAVLRITRTAGGFAVRYVSPCSFVCAEGPLGGDAAHQALLHAAFARDGVEFVQSLRRPEPPPSRTWFWTPSWSLSFDPVPNAGTPQ